MALPPWLDNLRRELITDVLQNDPRTVGRDNFFGVPIDRTRADVIGWGQADFDAFSEYLSSDGKVLRLSPNDKVLLYAYWNQLRHIEELHYAFTQLLGSCAIKDPIVLDLGCGPFTGGLALGSVLGLQKPFTYIGMDRATAMRELGDKLAAGAVLRGGMAPGDLYWIADLDSLLWKDAPKWRPVVVIVSYLLASPTLDATRLVAQLDPLLERVGRGPVTIMYTNSYKESPNKSFPEFRDALQACGFEMKIDKIGTAKAERRDRLLEHKLRYALFHRQPRTILNLDGG